MKLEAVIFGMDGVLIDTIEYHYLSRKQLARSLSIPFTRDDKLRGLSRRQSLNMLLKGHSLSEKEICELLEYKNSCFMKYVDRMGIQDLLPGVFELLWEIRAAQISVGVSSSSRNARSIISKAGIGHYIDVICDGSNVERLKPHPDIFLCTASVLGVKPENCMVIENGEAGIQAGLAAGMCVVGVGPEKITYQVYAGFPSLEDVRLMDLQNIYAAWRAEGREMYAMEGPEKVRG